MSVGSPLATSVVPEITTFKFHSVRDNDKKGGFYSQDISISLA